MRILIVEDSRINQLIARDTLVKNGIDCEILYAMDGEQALEMIFNGACDLVLLDIIMPKMTGIQVLEQLRETEVQHMPKIIMLTTIGDGNILKTCFELGASDYIKKPFEEIDFISRINSVIRELDNEKKMKISAMLLEEQNNQLLAMNEALKETQFHLVQKEKLMAIGELAAGIAHEINNPLAFVISNFTNIKSYVDAFESFIKLSMALIDSEETTYAHFKEQIAEAWERADLDFVFSDFPELIEDSQKGLDRVAKIVSSMRNFARLSDDNFFETVDINDLIEEVLVVVNNEIKYVAMVQLNLSLNKPVYCNKGQIEQVLLNLIVNAAQAIKSANHTDLGILEITTLEDYAGCVIRICDNGVGIDSDHISHIFDPFFTTKAVGQGTGLGLSISHNIIVDKHHGKINVDSEQGVGTCFSVSLPFEQPST